MKKNILNASLALTALLFTFTSCASKDKIQAQADSYDEEVTAIEKKENTDKNNQTVSRYNTEAEKKTFFERAFSYGNKNDFITNDTFTLYTHGVGPGIYQQKATVFINPENGTAGFGSIYLAAYYIFQYNPENYNKLKTAYEKYLKDFEDKKLDRKGKATYKTYGSMKVHLDWGTIKSSTPNYADGNAYIGYEFVKNSPYFTIQIYPLENKYYKDSEGAVGRESILLKYAFTKAQMQDLLNLTSEETVNDFFQHYKDDVMLPPDSNDSY